MHHVSKSSEKITEESQLSVLSNDNAKFLYLQTQLTVRSSVIYGMRIK